MRGRKRCFAAPLLAAAFFAMSGTASAATLPPPVTTPCPVYGGVQICSYEVPSFDGSLLDVDVTEPVAGTGPTHPLIVMLHGFGNNKHEWESLTNDGDGADKYDWNNHWFAQHGYYVLTYTARGFQDKGTTASYEPPTPSGDPLCGSDCGPFDTIHVKSRDYEVKDTQYLAALTAATFPDVNTNEVAVTGGSYGGGESWLQASQALWNDFPGLPVLHLQAAVPKYPWTDLAYSLAPNGHGGGPSHTDIYESSQTEPTSLTGDDPAPSGNPLGVPKASYISGLFASGTANGTFDAGVDEPFDENGPENIPAWNARITGVGDPYPADDLILLQAAKGLTVLRSAYYQTQGWTSEVATGHEVAVFSVQGWTDDLFEPVESFRMFKYLKRLDPMWPVTVTVADVGHSRAQNPPAQWKVINQEAWGFLQSQITGSHREQTTVSSMPTVCHTEPDSPTGTPTDQLTASTPEGLSSGALTVTYGGGVSHTLVNPLGAADPNGPRTDPIAGQYLDTASPGGTCRTSDQPTPPGAYTGTSQPLANSTTYVGLGEVDLHVETAALEAQVDARVWDVPPSGPAYLMTRGTYRIDVLNGYDSPSEDIRLPLYGNEWQLAPGHSIRLDLTEDDSPYLRPNNEAATIHYGTPVLKLPTRESASVSLTGTP